MRLSALDLARIQRGLESLQDNEEMDDDEYREVTYLIDRVSHEIDSPGSE
jgi:hypothetical protein